MRDSVNRLQRLAIVATMLSVAYCVMWNAAVIAQSRKNERSPHSQLPIDSPSVHFVDVSESVGIRFTYYNDAQPGRYFLPETMGGGVGWIDFDGDGCLDLFFANGCRLPVDPSDHDHTSRLYRNQYDLFSDCTDAANIAHIGFGQGCAVGDYDNDGFSDLLVSSYGANTLYHNQGDGSFLNVADCPALSESPRWHSSSAFGDLDRDGDLDLYVATYVETTLAANPVCHGGREGKRRIYCGPGVYSAEPDLFFENSGDGCFHDRTAAAGFDSPDGKSLGVTIADLDGDGWPDVYVANDMTPNFFFRNNGADGSGRSFKEMAKLSGLAFNGDGQPEASMGVACGDFDGDGALDLVVTNYFLQKATLYLGGSRTLFRDASAATGLLAITRRSLGFGVAFLDVDRDGWLDLFMSNGHVIDHSELQTPYAMQPQLLRNAGGRKFIEVSQRAGPYFTAKWLGRGAATADYDNDGATDIAVSHLSQPVALLHNESQTAGHYLGLVPVGRRSNRTAIGLRVRATLGSGRTLVRDVVGGGSYLSASDYRILIGAGAERTIDKLELVWPSGDAYVLRGLECGAYYRVQEGLAPSRLTPPSEDLPPSQQVR